MVMQARQLYEDIDRALDDYTVRPTFHQLEDLRLAKTLSRGTIAGEVLSTYNNDFEHGLYPQTNILRRHS